MGISIPEKEMDLCKRLMRPAWIVAGLTNDLFSWEKEYQASLEHGQTHVVNAIWVLMREHSFTVDQAKDFCKQIIKENVAEYLKTVEETRNDESLSLDLRRYVECMQYSLSGNVVWSLLCPRYHPAASYNESQLLRMKYGLKKYPIPSYREDKASKIKIEGKSAIKSKSLTNGGTHLRKKEINSDGFRHHDVKIIDQVNGHAQPPEVNGANSVLGSGYIPKTGEKTESIFLDLNLDRLGDEVRMNGLLIHHLIGGIKKYLSR